MNNQDQVGISVRAALGMFYEAGYRNELQLQAAMRQIQAMPAPCAGYVYANDVDAALNNAPEVLNG